ncbi:MAG: trypsin-like peptidase domain-containing protein [Clostridia bacterium]|nr:trypsin-like peptidase domain-containing protein [Clostridia bacterium]
MSDEKYFIERKRGMNIFTFVFLAIVIALLSSVATYVLITNKESNVTVSKNNQVTDSSVSSTSMKYEIQSVENPVVAVAKECSDSIVGISVEYISQNIFGMLQNASSSGSGIIYSKDGYIITNYHVIESAINSSNAIITVTLLDETNYTARIIGGDEVTDLAVIKVEANDLKPAVLGDSSKVQVGEMAIAIGNPLGQTLAGSVTVGYVSALNRTITSGSTTYKLIQTDAAINSGNSGGALLNSNGEVIGINSVKAYSTGVEGLGFAIPVNDAKPIIEELIANGKITRPYLGISGFTLSKEMAAKYNLVQGAYIQEVYDNTTAKRAGIKAGDVVTKIDDTEITTFEELNSYKNSKKIGDKVTLYVYRSGETLTFDITLEGE